MEQIPHRFFSALALTLLVPGAAVDGHHAIVDASQPTTLTDAVMPHPTVAAYGSLPIRFEPNVGQTSPQVEYSARGNGYFCSDGEGNAYVVGSTSSMDFPTEQPFQGSNPEHNFVTAFIAKFNAAGTALVYST